MADDVEHQRPAAVRPARPGSDGEHRLQQRMGTENRAAFSALLFLICELRALAVVGLARSSR